MIWKEILENRIKSNRKILFSKNDNLIIKLDILLNKMPRKAVILWALELAEETVNLFETKYILEKRPRTAIIMTQKWVLGEIKMSVAKRAILDCHAIAKEINSVINIARCHAIGQACGTAHTTSHATGFIIYDLTVLVLENNLENCDEIIQKRINYFIKKIIYWKENYMNFSNQWASFLI